MRRPSLGRGSGRHVERLANHGFENLFGLDIDDGAFDRMRETYAPLVAGWTFQYTPRERLVGEFDDGRSDAVCSVETLQHPRPDIDRVLEGIVRVTDELLVAAEIEAPTGGASSDPA